MNRYTPGTYTLYAPSGTVRPPWPSVIITKDMLPSKVRKKRRYTYTTPVFLLQKHELRWALSDDLRTLGDLTPPEELALKHPGLREAYKCLVNALSEKLPLSFWKIVLDNEFHGSETQATDTDSDSDSALNIDCVLQASIIEHRSRKRSRSATPSSSLTSPAQKPRLSYVESEASSSIQSQSRSESLPSCNSFGDRNSLSQQPEYKLGTGFGRALTDADITQKSDPEADAPGSPSPFQGRFLAGTSSTKSYDTPDSSLPRTDAERVEFDEMLDDDLVRVLIGPNREAFDIPFSAFEKRPHLKRSGSLLPVDPSGHTFTKPSLEKIDPERFRPVAEFLSSDDLSSPIFGPSGEPLEEHDKKSMAIEKFAWAWGGAAHLSLDDLMIKVIEKMRELQPWPLIETLLFASIVYATPPLPVDADEIMRVMLSGFIAHKFWEYVEQHKTSLLLKLRKIPELRQDVYLHMAKEAGDQMKKDEVRRCVL